MLNIQIIGIAGGSGSGKTTLARGLLAHFTPERAAILGQDHYYHDLSKQFDRDGGKVNFDHPSSIDFDLLAEHLAELKQGRSVKVPSYDFATHRRLPREEYFEPKSILLVDGILILSQPQIREQLDFSIFVDVDEDLRFERRLRRDVRERGRTAEGVHSQFYSQVKPMHDAFVEPSKDHAGFVTSDSLELAPVLSAIGSFTHMSASGAAGAFGRGGESPSYSVTF